MRANGMPPGPRVPSCEVFIARNFSGSMPSFSAISSTSCSRANDAAGAPGARESGVLGVF
jgi:hypothetical protein